jgi:hypothetical protein
MTKEKEVLLEILKQKIRKQTEIYINAFVDLDKYKEDDTNQLVEDIWFGLYDDAVAEVADRLLEKNYEEREAI